MNEKDLVILEQYDLHVQSTRRGRGSFLCDTDRGLVQVTEFSGSQERLFFQNRVLFFLTERGIRCDLLLENTEGNLVTSDRYGNGYVVKKWFSGRECDTKSREDIVGAVHYLAGLHNVLRLPEIQEFQMAAAQTDEADPAEEKKIRKNLEYIAEPLDEEIERHTKELKKVRNFMRTRKKKTAFESRFLELYPEFMAQAEEVTRRVCVSSSHALHRQCIRERRVCHGDYSQHNLFFDREGAVAVNFARCCFDVQISDFYQFFRKIMEKQGWNQKLGMEMIHAYLSLIHI